MDKKINLNEQNNLSNKIEKVTASTIRRCNRSIRNTLLSGIALTTALSISMSSISFAGTHTVDNWEDYKKAIVQDIEAQEESITINFTGVDKFNTLEELGQEVFDLCEESFLSVGVFELKNIDTYGTEKNSRAWKNPKDGTYSLAMGHYILTYKNSKKDVELIDTIISSRLNEIMNSSMSDYGKVRAVYEYVIVAFHYQTQEDPLKERNLLLGLQGQGIVCEAYAMLFAKMVTALGYENKIVSGQIVDGERHAWNLIKIDNQWYHVDATWGDIGIDIEKEVQNYIKDYPKLGEDVIRKFIRIAIEKEAERKIGLYFLTSDSILKSENHIWDSSVYPAAPYSYENPYINPKLKN